MLKAIKKKKKACLCNSLPWGAEMVLDSVLCPQSGTQWRTEALTSVWAVSWWRTQKWWNEWTAWPREQRPADTLGAELPRLTLSLATDRRWWAEVIGETRVQQGRLVWPGGGRGIGSWKVPHHPAPGTGLSCSSLCWGGRKEAEETVSRWEAKNQRANPSIF